MIRYWDSDHVGDERDHVAVDVRGLVYLSRVFAACGGGVDGHTVRGWRRDASIQQQLEFDQPSSAAGSFGKGADPKQVEVIEHGPDDGEGHTLLFMLRLEEHTFSPSGHALHE